MSPCRAKEKLTNVHYAAANIASNQVRVHPLKIGRRKYVPCQNTFAKPRSKTLNLALQFLKHVFFGPVRHMTIRPNGMFARRSPRAVEQAGLSQ